MQRLTVMIASITALVVVLFAGSPVSAQDGKGQPRRIVWISVFSLAQVAPYIDAYRAGLATEGLVEGRDVVLATLSAEGSLAGLPLVVTEAMALKPDVIVTQGAAIFGVDAIRTVPVVFGFSGDPIAAKLTQTLSRPSRNLTGVTFMSFELNAKRIDLLRVALPSVRRIALMGDPVHPGVEREVEVSQAAARRAGLVLDWYPTRSVNDVEATLARIQADKPDALIVLPDSVMLEMRDRVAAAARQLRLPTVSGWSNFAESGGLLTYGPRLSDSFKRLAYYTSRLLRGAQPSELPIEQPMRLELVVNLKTAGEIGLTLPPALVGLADEVIE